MQKIGQDILVGRDKKKAEQIFGRIKGKNPLFLCVGGSTETAKTPGISMAGKNPDLTDYTPAADLEIIFYGEPKSLEEVPATPQGIPTPALLTKSSLDISGIPLLNVNAGMKVNPQTPALHVGGKPGEDIKKGKAVGLPEKIYGDAKKIGGVLSELVDYIVIGETIPGGTTTALGTLLAMGVEAEGKISSSMPKNPHNLKSEVVEKGLQSSKIKKGELENKPFQAVSKMGDPMMPTVAGLASGFSKKRPVILAGGTQMVAILKILEKTERQEWDNIAVGTTRWIIQDKNSDLNDLVEKTKEVPILAADLDFSDTRFKGLKAYEEGFVKEGVGAGGAAIAAIAKTDCVNASTLVEKIEENYEKLVE